MDKRKFVDEVKINATRLFKNIEKTHDVIQFGIASGVELDGFYYCFNTQKHFNEKKASTHKWYMPEWKSDIGDITIDDFYDKDAFEIWNKEWGDLYGKLIDYLDKSELIKDEDIVGLHEEVIEGMREEKREEAINEGWDLLCQALLEMKTADFFSEKGENFMLFLETLDSDIGLDSTQRLYKLLGKNNLIQMYQDQMNSESLNMLFSQGAIDFIENL